MPKIGKLLPPTVKSYIQMPDVVVSAAEVTAAYVAGGYDYAMIETPWVVEETDLLMMGLVICKPKGALNDIGFQVGPPGLDTDDAGRFGDLFARQLPSDAFVLDNAEPWTMVTAVDTAWKMTDSGVVYLRFTTAGDTPTPATGEITASMLLLR